MEPEEATEYQSMVWPDPGVAPSVTVPVPQRLPGAVDAEVGAVGNASTVSTNPAASEVASTNICL